MKIQNTCYVVVWTVVVDSPQNSSMMRSTGIDAAKSKSMKPCQLMRQSTYAAMSTYASVHACVSQRMAVNLCISQLVRVVYFWIPCSQARERSWSGKTCFSFTLWGGVVS